MSFRFSSMKSAEKPTLKGSSVGMWRVCIIFHANLFRLLKAVFIVQRTVPTKALGSDVTDHPLVNE